jgi:hypothetical protein
VITYLNSVNQLIFVMKKCWRTDWILKYYLYDIRLQSVKLCMNLESPSTIKTQQYLYSFHKLGPKIIYTIRYHSEHWCSSNSWAVMRPQKIIWCDRHRILKLCIIQSHYHHHYRVRLLAFVNYFLRLKRKFVYLHMDTPVKRFDNDTRLELTL